MKLCVDCKHFKGLGFCVNPKNGISPIHGEPKPMFATVNRMSSGECGETGNWYEEISLTPPAPAGWWEWLRSKRK